MTFTGLLIIFKIYFTPHVLFIATVAMFVEQWAYRTQS
jgi:hypothetical protein